MSKNAGFIAFLQMVFAAGKKTSLSEQKCRVLCIYSQQKCGVNTVYASYVATGTYKPWHILGLGGKY